MKKLFPLTVLFTAATIMSYGQVNTDLSNLASPTAINQTLLPISDDIYDLGSAFQSWGTLYINRSLYLNDSLFLHNRGTQNTFVGTESGYSVTTGAYNTAGGYKSLNSNTTGNYNTAYGRNSMFLNVVGNQNTAFGEASLYSNKTGYCNLALGQASLYHNSTGFMNAGLGFETLHYNINGSYNTASGSYAMFNNISGWYNTASGYRSLYSNTSGGLNTAYGESSLISNNIGGYNTASGNSSLYKNTIGSFNTASGTYALYFNLNGNENTGLGYKALRNNIDGNQNVSIGAYAGYANPHGSRNVYLGSHADGAANVSNSVAIGYNVVTSVSNTIILGTSQNVGIGTTNPKYRLSVNGTIQAKEVRVETGWSDYVFEKNYQLRTLENVAAYINKNKHLPGIPSAEEIQTNGLAVGEVQSRMMAKIEELTLYLIQQKEQIGQLQTLNDDLKKKDAEILQLIKNLSLRNR